MLRLTRVALILLRLVELAKENLMVKSGPAKKLTIYVDETDKFHGKPVYEVLLDIFLGKKLPERACSEALPDTEAMAYCTPQRC